jgi:hypothetical protein
MAFQSSPVLDCSFKAAEDLSSYQYHFVKINSSGEAKLLDTATEIPDGVLQNAPVAGEAATVRMLGISKVVANAALDEGTLIKPEFVSTSDCGKAADGTYGGIICGVVVGSSGAEDDLASVNLLLADKCPLQKTVSTITTAGVATYTAAQVLGGLILRDPAGGNRSDVTPTAANIIAEMAKYGISDFEFTIRNDADAAETITVTAGTDVTLSGTMTIAQNNTKRFLCVKTAATTVSIYSLGTIVH